VLSGSRDFKKRDLCTTNRYEGHGDAGSAVSCLLMQAIITAGPDKRFVDVKKMALVRSLIFSQDETSANCQASGKVCGCEENDSLR